MCRSEATSVWDSLNWEATLVCQYVDRFLRPSRPVSSDRTSAVFIVQNRTERDGGKGSQDGPARNCYRLYACTYVCVCSSCECVVNITVQQYTVRGEVNGVYVCVRTRVIGLFLFHFYLLSSRIFFSLFYTAHIQTHTHTHTRTRVRNVEKRKRIIMGKKKHGCAAAPSSFPMYFRRCHMRPLLVKCGEAEHRSGVRLVGFSFSAVCVVYTAHQPSRSLEI